MRSTVTRKHPFTLLGHDGIRPCSPLLWILPTPLHPERGYVRFVREDERTDSKRETVAPCSFGIFPTRIDKKVRAQPGVRFNNSSPYLSSVGSDSERCGKVCGWRQSQALMVYNWLHSNAYTNRKRVRPRPVLLVEEGRLGTHVVLALDWRASGHQLLHSAG